MPGKHAPASPWSFYASLARSAVVGLIGLGLIVAIVAVTLGAREEEPGASPEPRETITAPSTPTVTPTVSSDPNASVTPSVSPSPTETGPPGFRAAISVLNATDRNGLAARIRAKLVDEGYRRVTSGNTDDSETTHIFYRGRSREAAEHIARLIPELGTPQPAAGDTPKGAVVIILGSDFQG